MTKRGKFIFNSQTTLFHVYYPHLLKLSTKHSKMNVPVLSTNFNKYSIYF